MSTLVWETPPSQTLPQRSESVYDGPVAELRRHPLRWARLGEFLSKSTAGSTATYLRNRFGTDFQFISGLRTEDNTFGVYGRYVGGSQ